MSAKILRLATARINYVGQEYQRVLNTTIKSGVGLGAIFAPTWNMVMSSKQGKITWDEYTTQYTALMRQRYCDNQPAFIEAILSEELVLCCYCKDTSQTTRHCHRYILADILAKVALHQGIEAIYIGELK